MTIRHFVRRHPVKTGFMLAALLIILLIGSFIIYLTDGGLRSLIEKKGGSGLGREFTISGPLTIKWDWHTAKIHAEQVRIGNIPGQKDPYMLDINQIDLNLKIWKLLIGRVVIPEITIKKPIIILEKISKDEKNWQFPALSKANVASKTLLPHNRYGFPIIGKLDVEDGVLIYRDYVKNLDMELKLSSMEGENGKHKKMSVEGEGTLQNQKFQIKASGSSLNELRDSTKTFPLNIDLTMGPTHILVDGTFDDPVNMEGVDVSLKLTGHNLADLFYLTGIPLPPSPPYDISGRLQEKKDLWSFNNFKGKVGDSDLNGNLTYDTSGERGFLKADLNSHLLDLDDLGGFIGVAPSAKPGETAAPEQKKESLKEKNSSNLFPKTPLKLDRLRAADMDVTLKADKINAPGIPVKGMNVRFDLKEGLLKLDPLNLSLADGNLDGHLTLDGRKDIPRLETSLNLKELKLSRFFMGTRFEKETKGILGGHIQLTGNGLSVSDIMAGSNGGATIIMQGGKISLLLIEASDLDIAESLPLLLGKDKTTDIRCGVGDFKITNGIFYSNIFVLDTTDTNLQGKIDIDLNQELIDAVLDAKPKDTSLLSLQSPIILKGSLKHPQIMLPAKSGIKAAGSVILSVLLTPLAGMLPYLGTGGGEDSNCRALIASSGK